MTDGDNRSSADEREFMKRDDRAWHGGSRIIIFGNSGSGKSTLAERLSRTHGLAHLDLDVIAWQPTDPPQRAPLGESQRRIEEFIHAFSGWVIEGCYGDLLELALPWASDVIFLDLPWQMCQNNARQRPWEPHKYPSAEAQDANLAMLLGWIQQYEYRDDTFSRSAHQQVFDRHPGRRHHFTSVDQVNEVLPI